MTNNINQAALNAALARAMGIPEDTWPSRCRVERHPIDDDGFAQYCYSCGALLNALPRIPPNFCNDAAASRKLVIWIAENVDRYSDFDTELRIKLHQMGMITVSPTLTGVELRRRMMTAPLLVIAQAAAVALGIDID